MKNSFPYTLIAGAVGISCIASPLMAQSASRAGLEGAANREIVRRQENLLLAEKLLEQARKQYSQKEYESAYVSYLDAVEKIPAGSATASMRSKAINEFSAAAISYAEDLINRGQYSDAEKVAKTVLLPEFNPTYRPAVQLLSNLEQPDYYNKTVTPESAAEKNEALRLLQQAEGYYARGSFDMALQKYEEVLNLDPYNSAARRGMEVVNKARKSYFTESYNETRSRLLWQVTRSWERPAKRFRNPNETSTYDLRNDSLGTEAMSAKLRQIILPRVDIRDLTLTEAVDYLKQQSSRYDNTNSKTKGVNIFLKVDSAPSLAPAPVDPALPTADGSVAPLPSVEAPATDRRISLQLSNVPLAEALRYLAGLVDLKVKVEPYAVSLVPLSEPTDALITREFRIPPGFIPATTAESADNNIFAQPGGGGGGARAGGVTYNAKAFLESQGVQFPGDATAQYVPAGSRLIVRNTPSNMDLIDAIVEASTGGKPTQVEIESKFLEVNQNNLSELGFDWMLGPFAIPGSDAIFGAGGTPGFGQSVNPANYPFVSPTGQVIGQNPVTSSLRSGVGVSPNAAVTLNSIDALLQGITTASAQAPGIFGIAGVFTNPQFQVVVRALSQKKGVDLLSAPKVTTKSGRKAVIKLTREFPYPDRFTPPQVPTGESSGGVSVSTIEPGTLLTQGVVAPSTPEEFLTRNIGVTLEVEPVVGPDLYTIDLNLSPEVVEFEGFVNYGSPILGAIYTPLVPGIPAGGTISQVTLTDNTINQPIFATRKVNTSVTVWDGQTVALGGLIREDVQKVNDKIPILGDIPIAGRLFRTNVDQKLKKNLIIFTSVKLIDAEGRPLRSELEDEELVEPLGLPDDLPRPEFQTKSIGGK